MGYKVSPQDYANLEQKIGKRAAAELAARSGWELVVPEAEFTPVGAPMASASPTGGLGGGTGMDGEYEDDRENEDVLPVGALRYADVQKEADAANKGLYSQMQSHISVLDAAREALRNRRLAPSNSEKWLAIAAALGQPTRTGSFGESLGNLAQALGAQKAERRKFEQEAEMLGLKYGLEAGTERMRLAQARATEADRTLRAVVAANKPKEFKSVVAGGPTGSLDPRTGQPIVAPIPKVYTDLQNNPTPENLEILIDKFPRFEPELRKAYERGRKKYGGQ